MKNEELQSYVKKRFKKINAILKNKVHVTTETSIHNLRTEMKKIRAVMGIAGTKNILKKEEKEIDKIFDDAGEIRTLQLVLNTLRKPELYNHSIVKDNKKKLDKLAKEFKKNAGRNRKAIKDAGDNVVKIAGKFSVVDVKKYLGTVRRKINKLSTNSRQVQQWHGLRKSLKIYLYIQNWLPAQQVTVKQKNVMSATKKLERILGNWHNDSAHLQQIEKLNLENPQTSLDTAIQKLISGKKKKETNIKAQLKKFRV